MAREKVLHKILSVPEGSLLHVHETVYKQPIFLCIIIMEYFYYKITIPVA